MAHDKKPTLADVVGEATGVNVTHCYQCGKCTAGCPMAKYMDLTPNQVMRLLQMRDPKIDEELLACSAIWSCAACMTCTQRCPKKLDPAAVMDALREISRDQGKASKHQKKVLAFHDAFLKVVENTGRMSELPLVQRYKLTSLDLFGDITLAPLMMAKGKLPLKSHKVKRQKDIDRIFAATRKRGGR